MCARRTYSTGFSSITFASSFDDRRADRPAAYALRKVRRQKRRKTRRNGDLRTREYLTEAEVERAVSA
jgi:hypothetical protein